MTDEQHSRPSERFSGDAGVIDLQQEAADLLERAIQSAHGHAQRTLYRHQGTTIAMFALREGAALPPHAADGVVTVHVLRGHARMNVENRQLDVASGHLARLIPGTTHDLRAQVPLVVLVHIARSP